MKKFMTGLFAAAIVLGTTGAAFAADRDGRDHRDNDRNRHQRIEYVAPVRHEDFRRDRDRDRDDNWQPGFRFEINLGGHR